MSVVLCLHLYVERDVWFPCRTKSEVEISIQEAKVEELRMCERHKRQVTSHNGVNGDVVERDSGDDDINLDDVTALVK